MPLAAEIQRKPLPNKGAERLLREAGILDIDEFRRTTDELRQVAFSLAKTRNAATLSRVKRALSIAIRDGWTLGDFQEYLNTRGIVWERWYTELVFRNAVQGAYNRARWVQMNRPHMVAAFPFLFYDAILDGRTSDICKGLDGKYWARRDFPQSLYPPNHHACRSIVRQMNKTQAEKRGAPTFGLVTIDGVPVEPAEGWGGNPATNWNAMVERRRTILEKFLAA